MDAEKIAAGLSNPQRAYLAAVARSDEPYTPRHGRTANWALKHGYADTVVRLSDGREGPWRGFSMEDRVNAGIEEFLGQRLSEDGAAVHAALLPCLQS